MNSTPPAPADPALSLLAEGVPLTLLLDLALPLDSGEIYHEEPADIGWVPSLSA